MCRGSSDEAPQRLSNGYSGVVNPLMNRELESSGGASTPKPQPFRVGTWEVDPRLNRIRGPRRGDARRAQSHEGAPPPCPRPR